jgi:flagellar motor switch protein FliG
MSAELAPTSAGNGPSVSGARKAAILLATLGDEVSATILRALPEDELQMVAREIARLGPVPREVSLKIMEEYHGIATARSYLAQGGHGAAQRMLLKAFGEAGGREMMAKLLRASELNQSRIELLQRIDTKQLARFLEGEHPQTVALVLGHLDAKRASALLMCLPVNTRAEAIKRLAQLRQFSPALAEKIAVMLHRRLSASGEQTKRTYSGFQTVADLLNNVGADVSREILESIESDEQELATSIRDLMFTFEDFLKVPETQMREVSAAVDKKTLTLALKGASEDLRNHFYKTMSSRAVDMMKEDAEALGPVRSRDVNKAQLEIVALARQLESSGKLVLKSEGADDFVV